MQNILELIYCSLVVYYDSDFFVFYCLMSNIFQYVEDVSSESLRQVLQKHTQIWRAMTNVKTEHILHYLLEDYTES